MSEVWARFEPGHVIALVAIVGGCLVILGIVLGAILTWHNRRVRYFEAEAALKQDMLNRGMKGDEIERVLKASQFAANRHEGPNPAAGLEYANNQELAAKIASTLISYGVSGEQVEAVMPAVIPATEYTLKALLKALADLKDSYTDEEQLIALVQSMCKKPGQPVFRG
jgi:hypothetical protein